MYVKNHKFMYVAMLDMNLILKPFIDYQRIV